MQGPAWSRAPSAPQRPLHALPRPQGLGCQRLTSSGSLGTFPTLEGCGCSGEAWCPARGAACPPGGGGALGRASRACRPGHLDQRCFPSTVASELMPSADGWSREASSLRLCPRPRSSVCLWGQGSGLIEQGHLVPSGGAVGGIAGPWVPGHDPRQGHVAATPPLVQRKQRLPPSAGVRHGDGYVPVTVRTTGRTWGSLSLRGAVLGPAGGGGGPALSHPSRCGGLRDLPTCRARRPPSPECSEENGSGGA